jgi:hypothetical protein
MDVIAAILTSMIGYNIGASQGGFEGFVIIIIVLACDVAFVKSKFS